MKKYLFIAFLPLTVIFGIIPTFSQEKTVSNLHIFGYLKYSDNEPAVRDQVCVRSGWRQGSAVVCTTTQSDGSFTLDVSRAEKDYYTFLSSTVFKNPKEWRATDIPELKITNLQSSINLTESEIRVELKLSIPNKPNKHDGALENGKIELCQINNPRLCNVTNLAFFSEPKGNYEFATPSSAYSISIKLWNRTDSVEWIAVDKNNKQSNLLQVKFGTGDKLVQIKAGIEEK